MREGLRLLMSEEAERLQWLRDALAVGDADIKAGRVISAEDLAAEIATWGAKYEKAKRGD